MPKYTQLFDQYRGCGDPVAHSVAGSIDFAPNDVIGIGRNEQDPHTWRIERRGQARPPRHQWMHSRVDSFEVDEEGPSQACVRVRQTKGLCCVLQSWGATCPRGTIAA